MAEQKIEEEKEAFQLSVDQETEAVRLKRQAELDRLEQERLEQEIFLAEQ